MPPLTIEYIVKTTFTIPGESSVLQLNKWGHLNENSRSIHNSFLNNINKRSLQKKVFTEGDFLTKLNTENESIVNVDKYISGVINSLSIKLGEDVTLFKSTGERAANTYSQPNSISIQGTNSEILSEYLNELVVRANNETISEFFNYIKKKNTIRLYEISNQRELLLAIANQQRLNQIQILTHEANLANSLGIIENNLDLIVHAGNNTSLTDNISSPLFAELQGEDNQLPPWFLFGEKALLERVKLLEERVDDTPYIPKLILLDLEKHTIDTTILESSDINALQLLQPAKSQKIEIKSWNKRIIAAALFGGFILSIALALMMNYFKEDETDPTTKTSR